MRVIGVCRFSYPAVGGFKRMHETVKEREAYLYEPGRLSRRFDHFELLTLPSIKAQTDQNFTFLIVTGQNMPKVFRERLHDITADVPQVKIVPTEAMRHRTAMQQVILNELGEEQTESIQFRLDDDDAVGVNFVRRVRKIARNAKPLRSGWKNFVMEFSSGFSVKLTSDGILAQKIQGQFLSCGLAVVFKPGDTRTVMNYGHHKLHHEMPTLIDPNTIMYLRSIHEHNDSSAGLKPNDLQPLTAEDQQLFLTRFNVDQKAVRERFGGTTEIRDIA